MSPSGLGAAPGRGARWGSGGVARRGCGPVGTAEGSLDVDGGPRGEDVRGGDGHRLRPAPPDPHLELQGGAPGGDQPALDHSFRVAAPQPQVDAAAQSGPPLLLGAQRPLGAGRGDLERVAGRRWGRRRRGWRWRSSTPARSRRGRRRRGGRPPGGAGFPARSPSTGRPPARPRPGSGRGGGVRRGRRHPGWLMALAGTIVPRLDGRWAGGAGPRQAQVARAGRVTTPRGSRPAVCWGAALFQATRRVEALKMEL